MARKKEIVTKADREEHHCALCIIWGARAAVLVGLGFFLNAGGPLYMGFTPIVLAVAAVCWIYAWVHSQLEFSCDSTNDCKDSHDLGKKLTPKKRKKRSMKKG